MGKDYSDIAFEDDGRLKLLIIVGTRPEVIRLSEVIKKCRRHFDCLLAHTGQNYDYTLNGIFFRDLSLDDPDVYLDAVGADLGETVGNIIAASYRLMVEVKPDALLILGDTNSCLSAIAAKRLHIPIFHMEAGNRCKDECLPEETNRRIVDVISDVNLAYSEHARRYLRDTGCAPERTYVTGSPMAEVLRANLGKIEASDVLSELGLEPKKYMLLSAHREENIDTEANFTSLFTAINALAERYDMPILYSCHPRSRKRLEATGFKLDPRVRMHEPMGFHDYNCLQMNAFAVVSDSGTLPEESSFFASVGHPFPAVCIRTSTERPEALDKACFTLAGISERGLLQAVHTAVELDAEGSLPEAPRPRLRRRDRVHQGGQDHPELHRRRGQDGVEESVAMGLAYRILDGIPRAYNKLLLMPSLRLSFAACGKNVTLGRRSEIAGAGNIYMGHDVYLGPGTTLLTTRAKIHIGDYVMSGPNLTIITGDHRTDILDRPMMELTDEDKLPDNDQDVVIGTDVWMGSGVTILKGVHISDHCVIAAGAVVTKDVEPEYSIWGVPARCLGSRLKG